jgi:hypothetical protein
MAGRSEFTPAEAAKLRQLIREKQMADPGRQKTLRARMRQIGFCISDHGDFRGFTVSDFDDLVSRGVITISDDVSTARVVVPARAPAAEPAVADDSVERLAVLDRRHQLHARTVGGERVELGSLSVRKSSAALFKRGRLALVLIVL